MTRLVSDVPANSFDPVSAARAFDDPADTDAAREFAAFLLKVEQERAFQCRSYKERCLRRRIAVRMRASGVHTFADYAAVLDVDPAEYDRLLDALTINVTKFFRNRDAWAALAEQVVPALFATARRPLRVWSAGCASGEEPYSLAALLHAEATSRGLVPMDHVQVLGTDIDRARLIAAAQGMYDEAAFDEMPPALRERYVTPSTPARMRLELRALTRFAQHDLLRDPTPDGAWDLIVCRNVVIYFDREAQDALFERFHAALVPGGTLFLGKVETLLGRVRGGYEPVDHRQRIFRRV